MNADMFLGCTKKGGQDLAESKNMIFRLIRIDSEMFMSYPDDIRADRICCEIDSGTISKAVIK